MNILIVENNPIAREMLRAALIKTGHSVEIAGDAPAALAAIAERQFRVIFGTCEMPDLDGPALCRAIRADSSRLYTHIVLMTSQGAKAQSAALTAGADDFMGKPFDPAELVLRMRGAERSASLQSRDSILFTLARLSDSRDPEAGQHLERVRQYAVVLARGLATRPEMAAEVNPSFIQNIYLASVLHDIGTVCIPDCIMLKPGRLSDSEFGLMKTHTTVGARTLQSAVDEVADAALAHMAVQIALTHHERYDGEGYPGGLKGDKIPLCGRIMALADVYDAVTSKRVYRSALENTIARSLILEGSGTHFDPKVVDAFVRNESQFIEIRKKYADVKKEAA